MRILLVDDQEINVFAWKVILESRGVDVLTANNGKSAVECISENTDIDIVFMDIMMPVMDGYEAMAYIRNELNKKELPLIAITGSSMPEDKNKCLESGATDYCVKPVSITDIIRLINKYSPSSNQIVL
ncbi:MAG: response regulator [Cyclobacteriaceae bacterium]|nr:response regulator [Cyclobacteriaceae bacterium]